MCRRFYWPRSVVGFAIASLLLSTSAHAANEAAAEAADLGRNIAERNCARCHAIGRSGDSPLAKAPPFRTLHNRYPIDSLAEALAEGILTGHPEMPKFAFEPPEIEAFITYVKSLSRDD